MDSKIPQAIKALRTSRGLSQETLALLIGVQRYQISDWEQGRSEPSINQLKLLSHFFGISLDSLTENDYVKVFLAEDSKGLKCLKRK